MKLLTKEQAQELDNIAINRMGIPSIDLMGNAGLAVSEYAQNMVVKIHEPKIAIICGKGNNAGDGYKAALDLKSNGIWNNEDVNLHFDLAKQWAKSVWEAWAHQHGQIIWLVNPTI